MKIMLLIPPTDLKKSYGELKKFSNPQPSIGIAYIASALRDNGYYVKVIDAYVCGYALEEILGFIEEFGPDVIGISVLTSSADVVYEIANKVRALYPKIKIVMGNLHASLFSDEILSSNYADFIVHKEGELTMLELLRTLESKGDLESVKGISFRRNNNVVNNPPRPHIDNLDSLPFPAWDLLPMDRYATDPRTQVKKGFVELQILATRGCPNQCTFCSSHTEKSLGNKYRMRSPDLVVDEMIYMYEKYGREVFSFTDLAFPLVRSHAVQFCNEIIKRGYNEKFKWVTECRVKPLDKDLLSLMKKAGCARLCFGVESGNNQILQSLKKNFTTEDVKRAVNMASEAGLVADAMFMIGLPGETEEMINETIDFAKGLNIRYAIFNIFVPYPGCELYDSLNAQKKIRFKNWSDFTSYPGFSGGVPVYVPDGLTKEKLMYLQEKAMKGFYLRPRFIFNEILNFKADKIGHYVDGLKCMLFHRLGK
ncbi:MAG: radical SAM protein [Candidatus Omnitrophica bacterium]|nr:radical SAM protein [Candidatus Omnitrophota bacterium]